MSKNVLVTGASGHVGGALVRELFDHGYTVRASVRDPGDAAKTAELRKLNVEIVKADLFDSASLDAACAGMDGLFQVAAVYDITTTAGAKGQTIIETGIKGAENILRAAKNAGVAKVVLTSSSITIKPVRRGEPASTEDSWRTESGIPYVEEKTQGERHAWKVAQELGLDMVAVLPGVILGPGFSRSTPSTDFVESFAKGSLRMGAPDLNLPIVDVRDVAAVHRLAYENGKPGSRYFALGEMASVYELVGFVNKKDPRVGMPMMTMPAFMSWMTPYADALMSKLKGFPHTYTVGMHKSFGGGELRVDDTRTRAELSYVPSIELGQTVADTMDQLRAIGRL